ncbi:MAG: LD-carboxypeptidase [Bacteroidales bacterium]|jgi:muramoyltetrapeptide carboxypeptidase|nr:LD-carboxypeptidase [Bacteroidales bacterium]MDD3735686.1 LD-carboxypeptidase [Bacteroidales bacterium]NLD63356.1 LD-carboxypeptidase [Bacteroidales bacterium]HOO67207.1 LD-carboxypeptidase [Bacteroidales bacterium]HPE23129.1 LD-carboxypeptidase [Bacteroidales bacterium]
MKSLIIPPYLKEGDRIEIITPASPIAEDVVRKAAARLEDSGFRITTGAHAFASCGPFAGTEVERLADIQKATDDPDVKAVLCSRGGYGMSRIVDQVDFTALKKSPKWYVGYSDITSLHLWLNTVCGIASLHAEMPLNYSNPDCLPGSYDTLVKALKGNPEPVSWITRGEESFEVEGRVMGGNISLIYSLNGTAAQPDTDGAILFIEEIGEKFYHLDRMLVGMRMAGLLRNLSALVVGGMEQITEGEHVFNQTVEEVVMNVVDGYGYPVLFNFPAGHINDNRAVYLGRAARLRQSGREALLTWR